MTNTNIVTLNFGLSEAFKVECSQTNWEIFNESCLIICFQFRMVLNYFALSSRKFRLRSKGLYLKKQYKMHQIQRKWKKLGNMVWQFWEEKRHYGNLFVSGLFWTLENTKLVGHIMDGALKSCREQERKWAVWKS